MAAIAGEVRGCFTDERRMRVREVAGERAGDVGVVVGEVGADELTVYVLEVDVRATGVVVDDEVEVARVHPERVEPRLLDRVRPE